MNDNKVDRLVKVLTEFIYKIIYILKYIGNVYDLDGLDVYTMT